MNVPLSRWKFNLSLGTNQNKHAPTGERYIKRVIGIRNYGAHNTANQINFLGTDNTLLLLTTTNQVVSNKYVAVRRWLGR